MKQIIIPYEEYLKLSKNNNIENFDKLYNKVNILLSYIDEKIKILSNINLIDSYKIIDWFRDITSILYLILSIIELDKEDNNEDN